MNETNLVISNFSGIVMLYVFAKSHYGFSSYLFKKIKIKMFLLSHRSNYLLTEIIGSIAASV